MPATVQDKRKAQVTVKSLNEYYESLNALVKKYELEKPNI
jgi:hypothetical protein